MIDYITVDQVYAIHAEVIRLHGGSPAVHDHGLIDSAVSQPKATFDGNDLYPTVAEKAAALGFSLTANHGFKDGNKRVGWAAMKVFLKANGHTITAPVDEAEAVSLAVSDHKMSREAYTEWVVRHVTPV